MRMVAAVGGSGRSLQRMVPTGAVDYEGVMARNYDAGRSLPDGSLQRWIDATRSHVPRSGGFVLDLGAGTGRFAVPLATGLSLPVIAMEPTASMRRQALVKVAGEAVSVIGGRAEQLPLRSRSIGLVWASQVLHHVSDLSACARELRRVLVDGGRVLVRGSFHPESWALGPYFRAHAEELGVMPTLNAVTAALADVGLGLLSHERIEQTVAKDGEELLARTRLRADSVLARLPDATFAAGLQQLNDDINDGRFSGPVTETMDLVAFGS